MLGLDKSVLLAFIDQHFPHTNITAGDLFGMLQMSGINVEENEVLSLLTELIKEGKLLLSVPLRHYETREFVLLRDFSQEKAKKA